VVLTAFRANAVAGTDWNLRLSLGPEFDTNVYRNPYGDQGDYPVTPDFDIKMLAIGGVDWRSQDKRHSFRGEYTLGGRVFMRISDEDTLINQLDAEYSYRAWEIASIGVDFDARDVSIISNDRAYTLGGANFFSDIRAWQGGLMRLKAGYRVFMWKPDAEYTNNGPAAGLSLRHYFTKHLSLAFATEYQFRMYQGNAYVFVDNPDGSRTLEPTDRQRLDNIVFGSIGVEYVHKILISGSYSILYNPSNSAGESILRHRVAAVFTAKPVWEIYINIMAALQYTQFIDGIYVSQQLFLEDDDENQNSVVVKLSRAIGKGFSAELKYGIYWSEWSTDPMSFSRQVFYAGVAWKM
jgi:hypothetical protein